MRFDLKKEILKKFSSGQDIETEMKLSILDSKDVWTITMIYGVRCTERIKSIVDPWLRGVLMASRSIGGKGSEQILNILYPRFEQYLFPYPVMNVGEEKEGNEGEKSEGEKKRKWKII